MAVASNRRFDGGGWKPPLRWRAPLPPLHALLVQKVTPNRALLVLLGLRAGARQEAKADLLGLVLPDINRIDGNIKRPRPFQGERGDPRLTRDSFAYGGAHAHTAN